MKNLAIFFLLIPLISSCISFGGSQPGQAAAKEIETRSVDASFGKVYDAAIESLFDLGYTITHSDKESGVVVGERQRRRAWLVLDDEPHDRFDAFQITLLIRPKGKQQTKVRIKTAVNKQRRFNKQAINDVWVLIERQVMLEGGKRS
jgi:hypothetical protein